MSNITLDEAEELLSEFVGLRNKIKIKKSKSKMVHYKYNRCKLLCTETFDYIVKYKVRKYRSFSNYEDLLQDGRVALILALNSYKVGRGCWFWWANHYVGTKVSREANRHSIIKIPIKKTKIILPYKVSQLPIIIDEGKSALESIEISESDTRVHTAIAKLPTLQRRVVEMFFEVGGNAHGSSSISKICDELKISKKDCQKVLVMAKRDLKKYLENDSGIFNLHK